MSTREAGINAIVAGAKYDEACRQIVESIAEAHPITYTGAWQRCRFCNQTALFQLPDHTEDCLWRRSQQLRERT